MKLQVQNGWSAEKSEEAERLYKRFLTLNVKYPGLTLVPNREIDEIWHLHILDTKKYTADCENIFGNYFHHAPTYGQVDLSLEYDKTKSLYRAEFNEEFEIQLANAGDCSGSDCSGGSNCGSGS